MGYNCIVIYNLLLSEFLESLSCSQYEFFLNNAESLYFTNRKLYICKGYLMS